MIRGCTGALLAVSLLATACSDDGDADTSAITSIPEETSSTTSTTEPRTVAPDVIPDDESLITEDYVQAVLDGFSQSALDAFLATRAAGGADERTIEIVDATSTETHAIERINSLAELALSGFERFHDQPGPTRFLVRELLTANKGCIVAHVEVDSSAFTKEPAQDPPPGRTMVELVPATEEQRSSGLNPTAWVVNSIPHVAPDDTVPGCEVSP